MKVSFTSGGTTSAIPIMYENPKIRRLLEKRMNEGIRESCWMTPDGDIRDMSDGTNLFIRYVGYDNSVHDIVYNVCRSIYDIDFLS